MLSQRLKIIRKKANLTQEDLGKKVNTTKSTISNYENGHSTPSNDMLLLLAETLTTSTDYLLGRSNSPALAIKETSEKNQKTTTKQHNIFTNNPELEQWYKELPNHKEADLLALKQMWEIIQKNRK